MSIRPVKRVIKSKPTLEGAGVHLPREEIRFCGGGATAGAARGKEDGHGAGYAPMPAIVLNLRHTPIRMEARRLTGNPSVTDDFPILRRLPEAPKWAVSATIHLSTMENTHS